MNTTSEASIGTPFKVNNNTLVTFNSTPNYALEFGDFDNIVHRGIAPPTTAVEVIEVETGIAIDDNKRWSSGLQPDTLVNLSNIIGEYSLILRSIETRLLRSDDIGPLESEVIAATFQLVLSE